MSSHLALSVNTTVHVMLPALDNFMEQRMPATKGTREKSRKRQLGARHQHAAQNKGRAQHPSKQARFVAETQRLRVYNAPGGVIVHRPTPMDGMHFWDIRYQKIPCTSTLWDVISGIPMDHTQRFVELPPGRHEYGFSVRQTAEKSEVPSVDWEEDGKWRLSIPLEDGRIVECSFKPHNVYGVRIRKTTGTKDHPWSPEMVTPLNSLSFAQLEPSTEYETEVTTIRQEDGVRSEPTKMLIRTLSHDTHALGHGA